MNNNILIPKKIKVGYNIRTDTYTGKLAYVVYYDNSGILRKEKSWENWRNKNIAPDTFANVATSGFVLNKKAGGENSGWNTRQTYCRIFDPRGFEFEITINNLLYILDNCNCIKGKGLEGEFIYGWAGTELLLIPTSSPDYQQLCSFNTKLASEKIISKKLIPGARYLTKHNQEVIYLGKYPQYMFIIGDSDTLTVQDTGLHYYFTADDKYINIKSIKGFLIDTLSSTASENYAEIMDKFFQTNHSWIRPLKLEYQPVTDAEIAKIENDVETEWYAKTYYARAGTKWERFYFRKRKSCKPEAFSYNIPVYEYKTLSEINKDRPLFQRYLIFENGTQILISY